MIVLYDKDNYEIENEVIDFKSNLIIGDCVEDIEDLILVN